MSDEPKAGRFHTTRIGTQARGTSHAQPDPLIGRVFEGRFEIQERLGEGGMGTVYRAYQSSVGREVAIKVVQPKSSGRGIAVKRFLREARLASQVAHANLITIYDFGHTHDGLFFLAMELAKGPTLKEELAKGEPLELERFLRLGMQLCSALVAAHAAGIVHRDLKPSNIMLDAGGIREVAKVVDFGLAKSTEAEDIALTKSKQKVGTPLYMAPEMIRAETLDARSDLYQLGCTLYEMASGQPPFEAKTVDMLFVKHLSHEPKPLLREDLGSVAPTIMSLLAKGADERPQRAADVHAVLESRLTELMASRVGGSPASRAPVLGIAFAMAGLALALGLVVYLLRDSEPRASVAEVSTPAVVLDASREPIQAEVLDASLPAAAARQISLASTPAARVFENGELLGKTPMDVLLETGLSRAIELRAEGHESRAITLGAQTPSTLAVTLLASPAEPRTTPKRRRSDSRPVVDAPSAEEPEAPAPVFRVGP